VIGTDTLQLPLRDHRSSTSLTADHRLLAIKLTTMSTTGPQFFPNSHHFSVNNPIFQNVHGDFNQYNGGELQSYAAGTLSANSYN